MDDWIDEASSVLPRGQSAHSTVDSGPHFQPEEEGGAGTLSRWNLRLALEIFLVSAVWLKEVEQILYGTL